MEGLPGYNYNKAWAAVEPTAVNTGIDAYWKRVLMRAARMGVQPENISVERGDAWFLKEHGESRRLVPTETSSAGYANVSQT